MEAYDTEREQIDAIKKWWKENGKAIIVGVLIGFVSLAGWQQWQATTKAKREGASLDYNVLLADLDGNNIEVVKEQGGRILNQFQDTPYAALTALILAKVHVDEGDHVAARAYLQSVIDQTEQPQLQHVARLRMARLLVAEDQASQALNLISAVSTVGYEAAYSEIKGDIHAALGNVDQARQAYEVAVESQQQGLDNSILKMKLDNLGRPEEDL